MVNVKNLLWNCYMAVKNAEVDQTSATTSANQNMIFMLTNTLNFAVFRASLKKQTSAPILALCDGAFRDRRGGCGGLSCSRGYIF